MINQPQKPPQEYLDEITRRYDIQPENGLLINAKGQICGYLHTKGYRVIDIKINGEKRTIALHHIMWWKAHGEWPTQELDHSDRNKSNPSISNLMLSTRRDNLLNTQASENGLPPGVTYMSKSSYAKRPYKAQISIEGVSRFLGYYATAEEAGNAYQEAKKDNP